ncbi:ribonuclease H-like domain-containing protein [Tanacetum coccineum]
MDSLDSILDSYDTSYTNPAELDSEYTLNYDNPIFNIQNEHCDEPKTKTIMDEIPSGESKVHIEVLSVLWGNRLPIPDSSLPLSSMRMEQYLTHTDYALWEVIVNGDAPAIASASAGTKGPLPPKNDEQNLAKKNELKAKSSETQSAKLEFHDEVISQEDANLKLLRRLPSAWNNIALIMRNKSDLDTLSIDDLYNNLKVYESEIKGQTSQSLNSQNVAFGQASSSTYADDVIFSFFANQYNSPQLDNEDLEQIDTDDLEEMDLNWQVAMLTMRVKRFLKKTGRNLNFNGKEIVGFDKTKVECYNCHKRGHFARECRAPTNQGNRNGDAPRRNALVDTSTTNTLIVQDGIGGYDWSFQDEEGITNFALIAYTSQGYQIGLESLEARIVFHEKSEAVYEEDIPFLKYDVQVKDISIKDLKNQLEEVLKEKDDLKIKLEKFKESLKNLTKLINNQISVKDKAGLGYDSQMNESEVVHNVFNSRESDVDDNSLVMEYPRKGQIQKLNRHNTEHENWERVRKENVQNINLKASLRQQSTKSIVKRLSYNSS